MRNKETTMNYTEKVASQMKKGLSNERSKIAEIGRVLREFGESPSVVSYHMNVDPDELRFRSGCHSERRTSIVSQHVDAERKLGNRGADGAREPGHRRNRARIDALFEKGHVTEVLEKCRVETDFSK